MGNTVGSLTQFQQSVIQGLLLGDGYLRQIPGRKNAFLEINHSFQQRAYVDWKYSILESISGGKPKARKGNNERVAYRFYTRQMPEMTELNHLWYKNRGKHAPKDFKLDPVMLAVWFMDDGSLCGKVDAYLNTQQFDSMSQKILLNSLLKLGLHARLNRDKQYYRIRFLKESIFKLNQMIAPHIVYSMRYKLSYDPVETSDLKSESSPNAVS